MSRKGEHYRHHFPPLAFKSCRVSLEDLTAVPCECDWTQSIQSKRAFGTTQTFCICGFHPHSDPEERKAEIHPKRESKPSCRRAHTQYILIKQLSLGEFLDLNALKTHSSQPKLKLDVKYATHHMIPILKLKDHFHRILRYKASLSKSTKNILTSFSNSFFEDFSTYHFMSSKKKTKTSLKFNPASAT